MDANHTESEQQSSKTPKKQKKGWFWRSVFWLVKPLFVLGLWCGVAVLFLLLFFCQDMPNVARLSDAPAKPGVEVLDKDGNPFGQVGAKHSVLLPYDTIPEHMVQAAMATEDRRFFKHFGVDPKGILRAMLINVRAGQLEQGGSSITQQLAKIAFLNHDRTAKRKVQELIISLWLELRFSKKQIMAMYLNRVYLGGGNYGIDAAAQSYFGKPAQDLALNEAAMLAGIINKPSRYAPHRSFEVAKKRMEQVLRGMVDAGYITNLEALTARETMTEAQITPPRRGNFFSDWVASQVPQYVGDVRTDVVVKTTIDPNMQAIAEKAVLAHMEGLEETHQASEAALVSMTSQGAVLAMVGGRDYAKSQFNRATQALRQPGSSFKLFVYLAAMEHGVTPYDFMVDEPTKIGRWRPKNYGRDYEGEVTIKRAFAESINTIAAKLGQIAGIENVAEMAARLGVTAKLLQTPSLTLGTAEVNLLEMTQAYAHLGSLGKQVRAYGITEIRSNDGSVLYARNTEFEPPQVLDDQHVDYMNNMLKAVVSQGTARRASLGRQVGGKTGTTQNYRDAWFLGVTRQLTTGVWVGNDDNTAMRRMSGGNAPARIFKDFMHQGMAGYAYLPLRSAPDVHYATELPWLAMSDADPNAQPPAGQGRTLEGMWRDPSRLAGQGTQHTQQPWQQEYERFANPRKKRTFFDKMLGRKRPIRPAPRPNSYVPPQPLTPHVRPVRLPADAPIAPAAPVPGHTSDYNDFWKNISND